MAILAIIALGVLILFCLIGLILTPFGLPGTFIIVAGAGVYNLIQWSWELSLTFLLVLLGLALIGEVLEWLVGAYSAKKFGASKYGIFGAIAGAIAGAIIGVPIPFAGSVLGMFIGAFLGAFIIEIFVKRSIIGALKAGIGAFLGRVGAILLKSIIALAMVAVIIVNIVI
jgi:uncharacterized protein YqgC (DUF456 family)